MERILRVGIIGAGGIARDVHIPNYLKHLDKVEIVAIADVVKETAEAVAEKFDIDYTFTDYQEMLDTVELDAVSICTPNKFHAGATIAAMFYVKSRLLCPLLRRNKWRMKQKKLGKY